VGFGIKDAETAKKISETADAIIVGSTIVSIVEQLSSDRDKMVTKVGNLALKISNAIN
jgi:tryptophan synthase alpha chain